MRIFNAGDDFSPENFDIFRFYNETLLISWHYDKLKVFRYDDPNGLDNPRLLLAPATVKRVQNFGDRIFLTCFPYGVYKLSKNYYFALLSNTGIGIGARFYQVLRLENHYISLGDKQAKTSRSLLKHEPVDGSTTNVVGLVEENCSSELMNVLVDGAVDQNELCIFSNGYEIYRITPDAVRIVHTCLNLVTDIAEVKKDEKVTCLLYTTNTNFVILMYADKNELIFEKIDLRRKVKTLYAFVDDILENTVWIIHSDGVRTHKSQKKLGKHPVVVTELSEQNITCLRNYNSEVLGLNSTGELVKVDINMQQYLDNTEDDNFVKLEREMLEGTDSIVEAICDKVKELQSFNDELNELQSTLKRINIYACEQEINLTPKLKVQTIANKTFVNCKLGYGIPEKCQLSLSVKSGGRKIFSTRRITAENETNIELPLPVSMLSDDSTMAMDLITLADEKYSWCLIKNCIKDEENSKETVKMSHDDKTNFVNAKLAALHNINIEGKRDIAKLNAIKNSVRRKFNVI